MLKNRLVVLEGTNGVGKSTAIKELKQKYPEIHVMAFPTQRLRDINKGHLDHVHEFERLDDLLQYHYQFLEDFVSEQERLYNLVQSNTLVLIDRYALSNYVYLLTDIAVYLNVNGIISKDSVNDTSVQISPSLIEFYHELEDPSLIIYLEKPKPEGRNSIIEMFYGLVLEKIENKDEYVKIKALQEDTVSEIERVLKERGYLN